ncbi:hypothetical protein, partial [Listeria fleischmannii]|uniref:hypothetical protein n=1 Tax=Listeria fleischmannii TaxID=1069827 RepID=UPI001F494574
FHFVFRNSQKLPEKNYNSEFHDTPQTMKNSFYVKVCKSFQNHFACIKKKVLFLTLKMARRIPLCEAIRPK